MDFAAPLVSSPRSTVEDVLALDVHVLRDCGVLAGSSARSWDLTWSCGDQPKATAKLTAKAADGRTRLLRFKYAATPSESALGEYAYSVHIRTTPCHFGGERYWFVCPKLSDGRGCGRRCRFLYATEMDPCFRCRECQLLTYESRQQHRNYEWESFIKHYTFLKREETFRPPRGRKAKERRGRRVDRAGEALIAWRNQTGTATLDAVVQRLYSAVTKKHYY